MSKRLVRIGSEVGCLPSLQCVLEGLAACSAEDDSGAHRPCSHRVVHLGRIRSHSGLESERRGSKGTRGRDCQSSRRSREQCRFWSINCSQRRRLPTPEVGSHSKFITYWLRGLDLNQRPLGYEPNELPGCSTPQVQFTNCPYEGQMRHMGRHLHPVRFLLSTGPVSHRLMLTAHMRATATPAPSSYDVASYDAALLPRAMTALFSLAVQI